MVITDAQIMQILRARAQTDRLIDEILRSAAIEASAVAMRQQLDADDDDETSE